MNTYCPNLSNAQVRQEFEDLVQAVGEDQAYLVWHRNNGYALTSAPNGAESLLFQNLLEKYHGDYNTAMQKKAAMYLSQYTDKNGKWYEGESKISLDENGEPHINFTEQNKPNTESAERLISYVVGISNRNNRFSKLAQLLLDNKALPYNLKYFKIDNNRDDIEQAAGMWNSLVNYIEVLGNNVSQESIDKHLLHELIHYNTEQILSDYKNDKITDGVKKEAIKKLYDIITYAKDFLSKDLQTNRDKYLEIAKRQNSTIDSRVFYAFDNQGSVEIDEFISEIFTNPGFQEVLNNIPYKESQQTIWDKIKDAISSIFGFDINKGSVLEEALKASSSLLQNDNIELTKSRYNEAIDYLFDVNSELESIGTKEEYIEYLNERYPYSYQKLYWHGTNSDFSDGLNTARRGKGSGAPETGGEMYFNRQPWASLQYINGVNRDVTKPDDEGFTNWVKLWWSMKEILGNGRMENDNWKHEIIGPNIRQEIPNKKGVFNKDKGGGNGSYLSERKAKYGYGDKSDKEFFEEVFDIRYGKETFQDWINRKAKEFQDIWLKRAVKTGIVPSILDLTNPIIEEGQNTYYEEQRGLFTKAKNDGNNSIMSNKSKNEFGSDVAIIFNPQKDVHFLGTKSDIQAFKKWKQEEAKKKTKTQDVLTNLFSNDNNDLFLKENNNTQRLLQQLINDSYIASPLTPFAEILTRHSIPIIISEENSNNLMSTFVDNKGGVIISINPKVLKHVSTGFAAEKLMHEVIHALTIEGLREDSPIFDRKLNRITEKLFNLYNKQFPSERFSRNDYTNGYNGLQDKYEFVAEFLTNPSFRQLLFDKAKQLDKNNNKQSVLQYLKSFMQSVINFFVNKKSNTENLEKYQLQLFDYINNKNAIVNGNIKSEQQLKDLIKSVDTYKFIAENVLESDELLQKLHPIVKRYNFTLGASIINRFIQNNSEYQQRLAQSKQKKQQRQALLKRDVQESFDTIIPQITQMLETRLKAVKVIKMPEDQKHKILLGLESQISSLKSNTMSSLNSIAYVLNAVLPDIIDESQKIHNAAQKLYKDGVYVLSDAEYMYEIHDYFGVYQSILDELLGVFAHPGINEAMKDYESDNLSLMSSLNDFIEKTETCKSLCDTSINILKNICSANVIARLENIGYETGNITDMEDYISSELGSFTTHDISQLGRAFGSADASSDHAVRALSYIVSKAISLAEVSTNNRVAKLQMLQHSLKFGESVKQLYELDENGLPTGYLVRNLNYGNFKRDYNKFMEQLNSKYSTKDEPLDPGNRIPPTNKENRVKWQMERNEWLGAHCHRRFNAEYYNKFAQLSDITKQRRDDIQIAINAIRSKVLSSDGTFYDYNALSDEDWLQLKTLYMQRRQLANIYDITGELKQGDDLLIAQELADLNKSLYDGNKAKRNVNKWKTSRDKIIAECGGLQEMTKGRSNINFDWKKLDQWDERNSKTQFKLNDDGTIKLFDDIRKAKIELLEKNGFTDKQIEDLLDGDSTYKKNKDRINKMLAPYRRLDTGDVDANILPELIKQKVIALQKENGKILKDSKTTLKKRIRKKLSELGKEYYDIKWTQQFADMLAEARRLDMQEQSKNGILSMQDDENTNVKKFLVTHGFLKLYDDGMGGILEKFTPYQFYTKIVPKDYDRYVEVAPGDNYIEQDPESSFLDKEFDPNENETYIPKVNGVYNGSKFSYDNSKAYNDIQNSQTLKNLYNEVINTIHETNEIYSNIPFKNDYQLPGITGTDWKNMVKRSRGGKWKSLFKDRIGRLFRTTEKDVDMNRQAATRPDGHQLSFIPQPYTAALKDPTQISTDLVGIVSQYYAKGQQYKEKTNVKDQCETILDLISRRKFIGTRFVKSGLETNTYQMARKFLNMNLYDQREDKSEIGSFNINKPFKYAKAWATLVNLGCSIKVATVGFATAYYSGIMNAITGKEYGLKEWGIANAEMLGSLINSRFGARIISQNSRLFQQNLMELFNLADQSEKKYKHTDRNVLVNQIMENWAFGGLTTADYLSKGTILDATLAAHRFFDGKFVSKDDLRRLYADKNSIDGGDEYQKALKKWKEGKTFLQVLKEAHKAGDRSNMFNIPSEYKNAVDKSFFYIQKRAQNYAARADGVMNPTQKAAFMTGMAGQAIMMHKQYLQPLIQQYFGAKQYNLEMQQYTYGGIRAIADLLVNPYKDGIQAIRLLNKEAINISDVSPSQKIKAFFSGMKRGLKAQIAETFADPINRQAIKRVFAEVMIYNLLISPLVSLLLHKADDDRDDKLLQLIAYIAISFRWESFNQYRFGDMLNTMKSPTAMTSVWDGLNVFADSFNSYKTPENSLWNVFSNVKSIVSDNEENNEIVQTGAYEGWTKKERALMKLTPFKNLKEQWDNSYAKRKYAQNQMYKQKE